MCNDSISHKGCREAEQSVKETINEWARGRLQGSSSNNNNENDWVLDAKKANVLPSLDEGKIPSTNDYPRSVRKDTEPHTNLTLIILEIKQQTPLNK